MKTVLRTSPIGVFDSGLGGLSILNELKSEMPSENFIYLGDIARLPYGTKSPAVVSRYARNCVQFLVDRGVKLVVIACNTASATALESLREEFSVEIHGVITPGVKAGLEASREGKVLVLGTEATVKSRAYLQAFLAERPDWKIEQLACPLLVPLAEEGWFDHPVTAQVIDSYLTPQAKDCDVIVLGCTHYPLLEESFRQVIDGKTQLVHGGKRLAQEIKQALHERSLANDSGGAGKLTFCTTDHVPKSVPLVTRLFADPVEFELVDL